MDAKRRVRNRGEKRGLPRRRRSRSKAMLCHTTADGYPGPMRRDAGLSVRSGSRPRFGHGSTSATGPVGIIQVSRAPGSYDGVIPIGRFLRAWGPRRTRTTGVSKLKSENPSNKI